MTRPPDEPVTFTTFDLGTFVFEKCPKCGGFKGHAKCLDLRTRWQKIRDWFTRKQPR